MRSTLRKARVLEIFRQAIQILPAERPEFLEHACSGDAGMRAMVESMLLQYGARKLADEPTLSTCDDERLANEADPLIGERVGPFRIRRHISSGGMGRVYEAIQDKPRRVVALKVIVRGIASRSALRRLDFEAQLLGRLRHPGIAQVYHAGTFNDGYGEAPYFAMEYIPNARSLTEYARLAELSTQRRMELFKKICDAVHHGHQKGIIHRDLKPDNILVDSSGQPKIIDFGVARSTDSDLAVTTLQTDVGQLIGTLQYMSPEQCRADPHDIDTRSDIYSLGVVLYELLTDQLPYDVGRAPIHDAAKMILETPAPKPSSINRMLRGDIETITLKALEKDRDLRYQSAHDLAEDIDHYLRQEAIRGRSPGMRRQIRRFAWRHRKAEAAVALTILVLLTATSVSIPFLLLNARQRAESEQLIARQKADRDQVVASLEDDNQRLRRRLEDTWGNEVNRKAYAYEIIAANSAEQNQERWAIETHLDRTLPMLQRWEYWYLKARVSEPAAALRFDDRVTTVCVNESGSRAAIRLGDGTLQSYDLLARGEMDDLIPEGGSQAIALSSDGALLASVEGDMRIRLRNVADGSIHANVFAGEQNNYHTAAFSTDGSHVAAATNRMVRVWDVERGTLLKPIKPSGRHLIMSIALNHDGTRLAIGYDDGEVEMRTTSGGNESIPGRQFHGGPVLALAFDHRGERLAIGTQNGSIIVWNTANGDMPELPLLHYGAVRALCFGDDSMRLASGSDDKTVRIWEVETRLLLLTLRGHQDGVNSVAFSRNGRVLLSGSDDHSVRVWDAADH